MAEIVDFGLQQHKIKMDSRYFDNVLSVVAGDTGRRIEVQLLDANGMVQNTTGLNLRLNADVEGKATYTDATLVDATTGKYQLDLSNGMFLAPGNWQFQWQITDSAGKKLHSFAFTGSVGKNISEGGSQATNFYLNLEDLKKMQDDLINGTIDSEVLETNIAEKLTNLETQYAPKLTEVTAQLAQTKNGLKPAWSVWEELEQRSVNVKWFGAKGDGVTDDVEAINNAIRFCHDKRLKLTFPEGVYLVTKPVKMMSYVILEASAVRNTEIRKLTSTSDENGINAVMVAKDSNNFKIESLTLSGDRKSFAEGNLVTTDGLYIEGCSYFEVNNVRASNCKRPFVSKTNWCCKYSRPVAVTSQGYAFTMTGSSTSHVWEQPVSWGCGGNFYIESAVYWTIISPACDHSDAGGHPKDPFLSQGGSGGNYLKPSYIYSLNGAEGTIISSGTENSFSKYIYCEGSHVTFLNPYIYSLECHADNYAFIETRGSFKSILEITNPNFKEVINKKPINVTRRGLFFENPINQKIKTNKFISIDSSFGDYAIVNDGVEFSYNEKLININPYNITTNSQSGLSYDSAVAKAEFINEGNEVYLKLSKTSSASGSVEFLRKIPNVGNFKINTEGVYSSSYTAIMIDLIESDGVNTNVLKSITPPSLIFKSTDFIAVNSVLNCYLRIRLSHTSEVLKFKRLTVESVL